LAAALDRAQVLAEAFENASGLAQGKFPLNFGQREMNDIVVVNFLVRQLFA